MSLVTGLLVLMTFFSTKISFKIAEQSIEIAKIPLKEPKLVLKTDHTLYPNFKGLSSEEVRFDPTIKKEYIDDSSCVRLELTNEDSIAAWPQGENPASKILIEIRYPLRLYGIGIKGRTRPKEWNVDTLSMGLEKQRYIIKYCMPIYHADTLHIYVAFARCLDYDQRPIPYETIAQKTTFIAWAPQNLRTPPTSIGSKK
jgi:hypothetical protein